MTTTKRFNFAIGSGVTAERILALKERDFQVRKPGRFRIYDDVDWNHGLLGALLDLFFYFSERKIVWEEFILFCDKSCNGFTRQLLHSVNALHSFQKISFDCLGDPQEGENICPGISLNKNLETVCIGYNHSKKGGHLLSQADFLALNRLLATTKSLKALELHNVTNFDPKLLSQGFSENKTLVRINLEFSNNETSFHHGKKNDERISETIQLLIGHPTLQEIIICTKEQFGDLSSQAIQGLLSNSSKPEGNVTVT